MRVRALVAVVCCAMLHEAIAAHVCQVQAKSWDQCGGKSSCKGKHCADKAWPTHCCPSSNSCVRNNEWYWNCQPASQQHQQQSSDGGRSGSGQSVKPASTPAVAAIKPAPAVAAKKGPDGSYDYGQVLGLSMLFYEAQRSGKLPANNRIKWRGDSGLDQKAPDGRDITGGWYDAGDNVKFNLPMAWSAGVLAWSMVDFAEGYKKAGEYNNALSNLKWATDYFIKCIGDGKTIVAQVGNGAQDHSIWGRPEDVKGPVPVYVVTPSSPGSDVVGAMGAALAAASQAFATVDGAYSAKLLQAAIKAYKFASRYLGSYSISVPDAAAFYKSNNYMDDIAWNALWLYIRTGNAAYKQAALDWYTKHYNQEDGKQVWDNYDWDSNSWGCVVMLSRLYPTNPQINQRINTFVRAWTEGSGTVTFTAKGLAYSGPWGSLRHVGNAMFLLKAYADKAPNGAVTAAEKNSINCMVRQQLGYILGNTGRSFVVGYGVNPPQRPHHRDSSCPPIGQECSWNDYNSPNPNPHTLFGALVGGPNREDTYKDDRNGYIMNEVATDYNAGFTGALAAAVSNSLKCAAQ
eukprot:GHRR01009394.1.p1 GENE.GHRR01009394.1~~GHRR01009394.1.p1  ORF type:complete len:572 (+),score=160.50 GHRR01009394.1:1204-2919(+)